MHINKQSYLYNFMMYHSLFRQRPDWSEGLVTPSIGLKTPRKCLGTPSKGLKTPNEGHKVPSEGRGTPGEGLVAPSKVLVTTGQSLVGPVKALVALSKGTRAPSMGPCPASTAQGSSRAAAFHPSAWTWPRSAGTLSSAQKWLSFPTVGDTVTPSGFHLACLCHKWPLSDG